MPQKIIFCLVLIISFSYSQTSLAQWNFRKKYENLYYIIIKDPSVKGQKIEFNEENVLFMAGMSDYIMNNFKLYLSVDDLDRLANLIKAGANLITIGNRYSDPNMMEAWKDPVQNRPPYLNGYRMAEYFKGKNSHLNEIADGIVDILKENEKSPAGGNSIFISTCTPYHSEEKCKCLAEVALAVFPDIHKRRYEPQMIKKMIENNPFTGFSIIFQCGISRY